MHPSLCAAVIPAKANHPFCLLHQNTMDSRVRALLSGTRFAGDSKNAVEPAIDVISRCGDSKSAINLKAVIPAKAGIHFSGCIRANG